MKAVDSNMQASSLWPKKMWPAGKISCGDHLLTWSWFYKCTSSTVTKIWLLPTSFFLMQSHHYFNYIKLHFSKKVVMIKLRIPLITWDFNYLNVLFPLRLQNVPVYCIILLQLHKGNDRCYLCLQCMNLCRGHLVLKILDVSLMLVHCVFIFAHMSQ